MKITVFTSVQARHLSLIQRLSEICDELYAVQEVTTLFPGLVKDRFPNSPSMEEYFGLMLEAEAKVFGKPGFLDGTNVSQFAMRLGDLNQLEMSQLSPALQSDVYVVFGASYIRGALCDFLVHNQAVNIHMGTSPMYRGNSCNFWALYDRRPQLVGATLHKLTKGLDSGPILSHVFPNYQPGMDGFHLGMAAVDAAQAALVTSIQSGKLFQWKPVEQDRNLELRYTKNSDYREAVVNEYLANPVHSDEIEGALSKRELDRFVRAQTF